MIEARNAVADIENLFVNKSVSLNIAEITEIVRSYDMSVIDKKEGIALVFIMENMNKGKGNASMYVTFFNIKTKEVLLTERMVGTVMGFGFRNYWIRPVYEVIADIYEYKYRAWRNQYLK